MNKLKIYGANTSFAEHG